MHTVLIIPARYESSRLPGKPLAPIQGREMILRVYDRCKLAINSENIYVATDDVRIDECCSKNGVQVIRTSSDCLTGTDRVHEASVILRSRGVNADIYLNVQGDEPLILPEDIQAIEMEARRNLGLIINGMCDIGCEEDYRSLTVPKVVTDLYGRLLYMSRAPIPGNKQEKFLGAKKQVCIYAFTVQALDDFAAHGGKTPLEAKEDIEILRLLEMGYRIQMVETSNTSVAVDTPMDLEKVNNIYASQSLA